MTPILLSLACSALLPVLPVQIYGRNPTVPLSRGQSQCLSPLARGTEVCLLAPRALQALHAHRLTLPWTTASCSWSLLCGQEPHQSVLCFIDQSQILLARVKRKKPLASHTLPSFKMVHIPYRLGTFQSDWE